MLSAEFLSLADISSTTATNSPLAAYYEDIMVEERPYKANNFTSFGMFQQASKRQAWKLYTSFGIFRNLVAHLDPLEQIRL